MNAARSPKKTSKKTSKPEAGKATTSVSPKATPTRKVAVRPDKAAKAAGEKGRQVAKAGEAFSLSPILDAIRKRVSGAAAQAEARTFADAFYKRMEEDEYPHHSADGWAAIAADTLAFARSRKPGTANVRIFNASLKSHGWESPHTVLQIINDDMPFLVDSVSMALAEMGVGVHVLGHPLVRFTRDKAGKVTAVGEGKHESLMLLEIDRLPPEEMAQVEKRIRNVLEEVRAIVRDWSSMREKMLALADDMATRRMPVDDDGRREAQEFLRWAAADHFTFFGYREYRVEKRTGILAAVEDSGLGLLREGDTTPPRNIKTLAAHYLPQGGSVDALILTKTNRRSTVHRPGNMDYIGVLEFDAQGNPIAEQRFIGLYTSSAYNRRPWEIPLVRERHEYVMQKSGLSPSGHSGKALRHILETLPREELFQSSDEELFRTSMGILGLQERVRSKLFLRRDRYGRFYSALVYIRASASTPTCACASSRC